MKKTYDFLTVARLTLPRSFANLLPMAGERFKFAHGLLVFGSSLTANYALFRAFNNNPLESGVKAVLAKISIPVNTDPDVSSLVSVWIWVLSL